MTTQLTTEDMELLFGRVVNRVILYICPVILDPTIRTSGECWHDGVRLRQTVSSWDRLGILLHEVAHYMLHVGPETNSEDWKLRPAWEYEAESVSSALCIRFGVPVHRPLQDAVNTQKVLNQEPYPGFHQELLDNAPKSANNESQTR